LCSSPKRPLSAGIADWNPFSDDNFGEAADDVISFGHEFDRIRRGSNTSEYLKVTIILTFMFGDNSVE